MSKINPSRPLRVLYGITKSNFGGAQRYVYDLATESREEGFKTAVLCGVYRENEHKNTLTDKLKEARVVVVDLPSLTRDISIFGDLRSFFFIIRTLRKTRPDVFHINSSKMGGLGSLAGRITGVRKIIFTSHGWSFNEDRPRLQKIIIKFLAWLTVLLSHKTICVSEQLRSDMIHLPFIKNKLVVIRNGLKKFETLAREEARARMAPDLSTDIFLVGTVAELHHVKGLDVLLDAWSEFKKNSEGELIIIGEGQERLYLESSAKIFGISDSVHFLGYVDNARSLLRGFDLLVMPSRSEGLPYALLEAGSVGLPVVASRVGGIPEVIEDEVSGVLVPPENPTTLLSAISYLAHKKDFAQKMGQTLQRRVEEDFSMEKMIEKTLQIYSE